MHVLDTLVQLKTSFAALPSVSSGFGELAAALPANWQNKLLQKPYWAGVMFAVRVALALLGVLFLIYEVRARRMGFPLRERTKKRIALLFIVLSVGVYFDFGNPNVRYSQYYHRHELYHYYLGAKYFGELGYSRLYDCTLVAEIDNGRRSQIENREFRDLRENLIKKAKDTYILTQPERCRDRFSTERWEAFRKDVGWFYDSARGSYWERMQQDHGYNPPPVWTMTGKAIASIHPADDKFFKVLASLDVMLQLGMLTMLYVTFGWRVGAIGAVFWGCNAAANFYWTGGAFLRQDWMFLLVASVCLARKRRYFWAGAALMWSALLRVFPAALFVGWGVMIIIYVVQRIRGRAPAAGDKGLLSYLHPSHRKLIAGSVVALGVLVPLSMLTTGGVAPYREFVHHIALHKKTPLTNHMGLPTILSHNWEGRMRFTRNENLDDAFVEWKDGRNARKDRMEWLQRSIFVACVLWIAWALRRSQALWLAPALSLVLVMCVTDLTCYYYSMFIIAAVLAAARRSIGVGLLATTAASVVLLGRDIGYADVGLSGFYYVDDNFTAQSYLFFLFCLLSLWAYSRPFSMASLRAWLARKPEPRPADYEKGRTPTGIGSV
ncbi:MAG TPA: hypothetical protein VLC09_09350 [Polyangiaceae bacterium]|nr:hypothetical protein [Polyangiaceae bacterium]